MYRQKRTDTFVGTVEDTYRLRLNARRDMHVGTLLKQRGFESLTQLVTAARGQLNYHPCPRRIFSSFHGSDLAQVNGFRLMAKNPHLSLDIENDESRNLVNSQRSTYIKRAIRQRISSVDVVICLIGNGTAWRDWVDWEIQTALEERCGICAIRLKGATGRAPSILHSFGAWIVSWGDVPAMTAAIERAAALRS